jgi:hypothetical protein
MSLLEILRGPGFCNEELDLHILIFVLQGTFSRLRTLEWGPYITDSMLEALEAAPAYSSNTTTNLRLRGGDEGLTSIVPKLLSTMPLIQNLDLSSTDVTTDALSCIPHAARLTHLNLKPSEEVKTGLTHFMSSLPSITSSLKVLNLNGPMNFPQNQNPDDLSKLLAHLPPTLKSLDMSSCVIYPSNISEIRRLCTHLDELSIGAGLRFRELEPILLPNVEIEVEEDEQEEGSPTTTSKYLTVLAPIADAVAICKLRRRLNTLSVKATEDIPPPLKYLDIRSMALPEQRKLKMSVLLSSTTTLEIIEFSEEVYLTDERMPKIFGAVGWKLRCRAGRCWIVRK